MSRLFEPFELHGVTARNRMWMPPMCQFTASSEGSSAGWPNDWHEIHYGARAAGGVGAVIVEATAVCPEGRISPFCLMLDRDEKIPGFARLATLIKEGGALAGIQISHAGRKASSSPSGTPLVPADDEMGGIGWHPVAPSPIPFSPRHEVPRELDLPGIKTIQNQFVQAARRALEAGFDFVELHGAHGYLMHEFLSPITNHRIDEYGGDLEGRFRFWKEIIVMIRAELGSSFPLLVRISATSWLPESNLELRRDVTLDDWGKLAHELSRLGVDFIDVSTGGLVPGAQIPVAPGYQVPYAQEIQNRGPLPVSAVGLITEPAQAEQILVTGAASVVEVGRPLLTDPSLPLAWAARLGDEPPVPEPYTRGTPRT
ncbi:NADH:flavin oxidoreductase/NADH oxidase [Mobiluncus mulieris]|uniref:NADH:flavin oxidoreductase/NADH oxidase n=1 Tax=Mobiluncus mulieris TaxID=2052 RepID=A0A7Y0U1N5_9ACTO|nr:NADH:flavin oxidoreductase/NADH oxidase [Mobiluncus mulieris]NMW65335.1 NADH:flavin oxidoreductase/NADH oxidase [Mobiluncus mulieris]NMX11763.1 NADH:flavin oxidoreductase/NADH oxidase [Mobiluncus mulieris]